MASFLERHPGTTTGPAGAVHSISLSEYGVWPLLTESDRSKLLINMHDFWFPKADRSLAQAEIERGAYFTDAVHSSGRPPRLFKMMKPVHAEALCRDGVVGLGPLKYYTTVENRAIADASEGLFITHADGERNSVLSVTSAGSHVLLHCTTSDINARFDGYEACVEIIDGERFAAVISAGLNKHFAGKNRVTNVESSKCVYQHSRIISGRLHGFGEALLELGELSKDTIDVLSDKKYLIKDTSYSKDREFRSAFVMQMDVAEYVLLSCPEVSSLCRRIR
jgi:hypothetical protein